MAGFVDWAFGFVFGGKGVCLVGISDGNGMLTLKICGNMWNVCVCECLGGVGYSQVAV